MRLADIIRRAGRNLRQAKVRTLLTSLAIAVGAFTIALAMAAGNGGRAYLESMVGVLGSTRNLNVIAKQDARSTDTDNKPRPVSQQSSQASADTIGSMKMLSQADIDKINQINGVESVMPMQSVTALSASANGSQEYEATVKVQSDDGVIELTAGQLGDNYEIKPGELVLPHVYVESFGFQNAQEALDQQVQLTFSGSTPGTSFTRHFKIVAVDRQPASPLAFYQDEFIISNRDGADIARQQRPEGATESFFALMVRAKPGVDVNKLKQDIEAVGSFEVQTFAEMRTSVMQVINIVQYGLMGFGALAILASIFGIINTQYISVLERTQQIGLMKALGMRRRDISRLFRYESAWIGFLGGLIGVLLAFVVTLANPIISDLLKLEKDTQLLQMDWLMSSVLIIGLVVVAILSGWAPSRKASKLDPIEALRTE